MGGGMGMMVTPDMLKKKKSPIKTPVDSPEEKEVSASMKEKFHLYQSVRIFT